jgi:hypothetical protein
MPAMPPLLAEYAAWPIWPSNAATLAVEISTPRSPVGFRFVPAYLLGGHVKCVEPRVPVWD